MIGQLGRSISNGTRDLSLTQLFTGVEKSVVQITSTVQDLSMIATVIISQILMLLPIAKTSRLLLWMEIFIVPD
ncbi:MAG: hypothetical protein ACJ702_08035, partial [Nitrososphaeraceae archaeon]